MNLASHVENGRRAFPARAALRFEGRSVTYAELDRCAGKLAGGLRRLGIQRGDRVALLLPNIPEFAYFYLAALKLGAIAVSLHPALKPAELRMQLQDCGAAMLVTTGGLRPAGIFPGPDLPALLSVVIADGEGGAELGILELMDAPEAAALDLDPAEPAAIVYTSGTTGTPKGVTLSHANIHFVMASERIYQEIRPDDCLLLFLPLHHCFGQNAIMNSAWFAGATVALHRGFDAPAILAGLKRDRVTQLYGVPTTFRVLLDLARPEDLAGVRYCFSAAAPLPLETETRWRERFGMPIHQGYGLTETSPFASYNHVREHRPGSIGSPIAEVEMAVVEIESRRPLNAGETGEIIIRGPNVMLGYWNRPEETAAVVRDGWFSTGDVGERDSDGYFYLRDRLKDMVIVGGSKVYPAEVENVLYRHPAVAEAAVFGVPDALLSERVCAWLVARGGAEVAAAELLEFCRPWLAEFKLPAEIRWVERLPKSPSGKVLKRVLREEHAAQALQPAAAAMRRDAAGAAAEIRRWLASALGRDAAGFDPAAAFADLGLTSLQAVELALHLGRWSHRDVPPTATWNHSSIAALARYVAAPEEESPAWSDAEAEALLAQTLAELELEP